MTSIWDDVLTRIQMKVSRHEFYRWFRPTAFVEDAGQSITVRVPNRMFSGWLTKHYSELISEALADVRRPGTVIRFVEERTEIPEEPPVADVRVEPASRTEDPVSTPNGLDRQPAVSGLIPRYTFDTFVVGPSNQFAHAACRAVAEAPPHGTKPHRRNAHKGMHPIDP
jgi:chromosomal replication initiator protein